MEPSPQGEHAAVSVMNDGNSTAAGDSNPAASRQESRQIRVLEIDEAALVGGASANDRPVAREESELKLPPIAFVPKPNSVGPSQPFSPRTVASGGRPNGGSASKFTPAGLNGRVTQGEVNSLKAGLGSVLTGIENNLVDEVFGETFPLVGANYSVAWSNNASAFRYLTILRTNVVAGLNTLTNAADYAPSAVASAINTRLTGAGFASGSAVTVTTVNNEVQLAFTTSDTFTTNVPISTNFALPNLSLLLSSNANCAVAVRAAFNFTAGVDGSGFYLDTSSASFQFNATNTVAALSTGGRFVRLPYLLTDNTTNRTSVPLNMAITLKSPGNNGTIRAGDASGNADLLDATLTGNTKVALWLYSALPSSVLMPAVGTALTVQWNFNAAPIDPTDHNFFFGSVPAISLGNWVNLDSFFNSFADRALDQIDRTTEPLQPVIDVLTAEIPLLSDLGSDEVTVLDILGVPSETVAALGGLAALVDLADLAHSFTGNSSVYADLGGYAIGGDVRLDPLADLPGVVTRPVSSVRDADLNLFRTRAAAVPGLAFPILEDANVIANLLLGKNATLFTWQSGEIEFSEQFSQFFPVLGPVGIKLGGQVGLKTQFGFGYDTQGIFDYYAGGSADSALLNNGFFAIALDESGNPLTGITLSAGITAGIEANFGLASFGVEGDLTATVGIYLDDLRGDSQGRVRGQTLLNTPLDDLFYASGSLSAGLRAYLEVGLSPFSVSFDFESPRVTLISFDSRDATTPVLGEITLGNHLTLNVGDRAPLRLHGDTDDRAEEFFISNGPGGGLSVFAFNEQNDFALPTLIVADGNLRGDSIATAADVTVPVRFTGGPGFDSLTGGAGDDVLDGGEGPDRLSGRDGNDTLRGGGDNDLLNGGDGFDILDGGPGLDMASWVGSAAPLVMDLRTNYFGGAAVGDTLISIERYEGTTHDDTMNGSEGDDNLLRGSEGNDTIRGFGGSDQLEGGEGNDTIDGGAGNDLINGGPGADILDGGEGIDILSFLGAETPVTASLLTGTGTRGEALGDTYVNFEILMGSGIPKEPGPIPLSGDILEGSDNADTIYGMDGADTLRGAGGNDIIFGNHPDAAGSMIPGYDADKIYGGAGNDLLYGQSDDDLLDGEEGMDILDGGLGNDHLITMDLLYPDFLDGGEGYNRLSADYSDKTTPLVFIVGTNNAFSFPDGDTFTNMQTLGTLRLGASNDLVRLAAQEEPMFYSKNVDAGPGDDLVLADWRGLYQLSPQNFVRTSDVLSGGPGNDTLSFEQSIGGVTVNIANNTVGGAAAGMTISGFENLIGTRFTDTLTGDAGPNILNPVATLPHAPGVGGNDYVDGGGGVDTLRIDFSILPEANIQGVSMGANTGTGYESISLGQFNTPFNVDALLYHLSIERFEIVGSQAADKLYGESINFGGTNYNDIFFGLGGNDLISSSMGDDYIDGGEGNDALNAGAGNDVVFGGPGDDSIVFDYADNQFSTYGSDFCDAGPGNDFVRDAANAGNDATAAIASTVFKFDGGDGYDTLQIDVGHMTTPFVFDENNPPAEIVLPNGGYLRNFEHIVNITTGNGNDVLVLPGRVNNRVATRFGNDVVNPGMGFDSVDGGLGGDDLLILDYSVLDNDDTSGVYYSTTTFRFERRSLSTGTTLDQLSVGNIERVILTGTSKTDNLAGYDGNDRIYGGAGDDGLTGYNGNDWLDGGLGADTMVGGVGSDTYLVDNPGDIVTEQVGAGNDTVRSSIDYTLPVNVELLVLTGSAINGTGNTLSNAITGNSQNNYLRGEGGNDLLNGGGGSGEIDRLNGGPGADVFVLGEGAMRYYDDGSISNPGHGGYAIIEDFTTAQGDRLRLAGTANQYFLGASPIVSVSGTALYHDSNANSVFEPATDELIAILVATNTLTISNTLNTAVYETHVDPVTVGLTNGIQGMITNDGSGARFAVSFAISETITNNTLFELQASTDLGASDPWLTIASKAGSAAWSGIAPAAVSPAVDGRVTVTIADIQPIAAVPQRFFRLKLSK